MDQLNQGEGAVAICSVNKGQKGPSGTAASELQRSAFGEQKSSHNPSPWLFVELSLRNMQYNSKFGRGPRVVEIQSFCLEMETMDFLHLLYTHF